MAALPPPDRPRYERWLRGGGLAAPHRAAPNLFDTNGAAPMPPDGPTATTLAQAIQRIGLDRWPRAVAAAATATVELPPGTYFAPLVPLMNRILVVRPGDDVNDSRRDIKAAFYDVGDTTGGDAVNRILSDLVAPDAADADRRAAAEDLAHYAHTDPALMGQLRTAMATSVLSGMTKAPMIGQVRPGEAARRAAGPIELRNVDVESGKVTQPIGELRRSGVKDAHHVIQDAAVRDLPGYNTSAAPGVQLEGPPTTVGTAHYNATGAQRELGGSTYGAERAIAYSALRSARARI